MLYENADPYFLHEPGGTLDVTEARYDALDETCVRVTGSIWREANDYTVKLEGARVAGYQTVVLAILRDPHYVAHARQWAADIVERCKAKVRERTGALDSDFEIEIRLIGQNAVLGPLERKSAHR